MEFALELKIKNKPLHDAVKKLGSQSALAKHLNVPLHIVGRWVNLKSCPNLNWRNGYWEKKIGVKLFELTGCLLSEIFPPELHEKSFLKFEKTFTRFVECQPEQLRGFIPQPMELNDGIDKSDLEDSIANALSALEPREAAVIKMRFGLDGMREYTHEEVGAHFGVTKERIRQIQNAALEKLRSPKLSEPLKLFK